MLAQVWEPARGMDLPEVSGKWLGLAGLTGRGPEICAATGLTTPLPMRALVKTSRPSAPHSNRRHAAAAIIERRDSLFIALRPLVSTLCVDYGKATTAERSSVI